MLGSSVLFLFLFLSMADIVYDEVTCPNPEVVMMDALTQMATLTKSAICKSLADSKSYTDAEVAGIQSQIDALSSEDVIAQITALKSLVDTLDLDVDGSVVNDLLSIKALAESAQAAATNALATANTASSDATTARQDVLAISQSLANFQTSVNSTISSHESRISELEGTVADLTATIEGISTGTGGTDVATVTAIAQEQACAIAKKMQLGISAGLVAFAEVMNGDCPIV